MVAVVTVAQMLAAADPSAGWPAYSGHAARGIPAVGRALGIYRGQIGRMPMDCYRGVTVLPRPPLLEQPDPEPTHSRGWFVAQHVDDLLLNGNAVHYITSRYADGLPAHAVWLPASRVDLVQDTARPMERPRYLFDGVELPRQRDVVHVQLGADRAFPWRGVGLLEQHLRSLSRVYNEEAYEAKSLSSSGVPSVAVIAPNPRISDDEVKQARAQWDELYGGPGRVPGIFPAGTEIKPLAWSPTDAQLQEARAASITDVANIFNLDGYWLGSSASSHTYRSPGPMFTTLLRVSLEPILDLIESVWSAVWLPRGQVLRFVRKVVEQDTMGDTVKWVAQAVSTVGPDGTPLMSIEEGRAALGLLLTANTLGASAAAPALPTGGTP
jgi:HK97 family phage portal protein